MPYIKKYRCNDPRNNRRNAMQEGEPALSAGELNYQIFYFIKHNYNPLISQLDGKAFIEFKIKCFIGYFF